MTQSGWIHKVLRKSDTTYSAEAAELAAEMRQIGLEGRLFAIFLSQEATEVISDAPALLLLPSELFLKTGHRSELDYETVIVGIQQSIDMLRNLGPTALLAESLLSLARMTGQLQAALEAISILREIGAPHRLARAYIAVGDMLCDTGSYYDALLAFDRALEAAKRRSDVGAIVAGLHGQALTCVRLSLDVEALDLLSQARQMLPDTTAAHEWLTKILSVSVEANMAIKRYSEALDAINTWITLGTKEYEARFYRGEVLNVLQGPQSALNEYIMAAVGASTEVIQLRSEMFRGAYRRGVEKIFEKALSTAIVDGSPDLAFGVLELSLAGASTTRNDRLEAEWEAYGHDAVTSAAASLAEEINMALPIAGQSELRSFEKKAEWLLARHRLVHRPWTMNEITKDDVSSLATQVQSALPMDCMLLEFANVGGEVFLFGLTHDIVLAKAIDLSPAEIRLLAQSFIRECNGQFPTCALDLLAKKLLHPVRDMIRDSSRVVIVPTVDLYGIPFHAMKLDDEILINAHSVSYARHAQDVVEARARLARRIDRESSWIGLGVPTVQYAEVDELPGVAAEVQRVSAQFDLPEYVLDPPATARDLLELSRHYDILHIACHGEFIPGNPLLSRLLLADRPVFAFEIMFADICADRVILTGCATAKSGANVIEDPQSLAYAFMAGGAKAVLATLWSVDDELGAECMQELYEHQLQGKSLSEALCDAQRSILARRGYDLHPYYWAPFAVFGVDW
jgi:tetratricopeptide (TPR) repeat protein